MSHSEKDEPTLPIRSPELKSEMAAIIGLIANNLAQRTSGFGQAGGARGIRTRDTVSLGIVRLDALRWLEGPLIVIRLSSAI
jgi:hypothetical protein